MSLHLNKNKGKSMRKIGLVIFCFFITLNIQAEDKLDVLDKQSKEFFKAITGLEKDYLEEQINSIKNKKAPTPTITPNVINPVQKPEEKKVSQEEYEKNVFEHENEMARLTSDFTRTKKLKDIRIKSMYSFNGKDYVVLKLKEDNSSSSSSDDSQELSFNIEGRYTKGDSILTHRIISINKRTKTVQLYKKLDEEFGYYIYLSNYGISVSDLKKQNRKVLKKVDEEIKKEKKQEVKVKKVSSNNEIKRKFQEIANKPKVVKKAKKVEVSNCLYTVAVENLNVRNYANLDATILRILRINDQFTIKTKKGEWVQVDTIYKKKSGDVMIVVDQNNWLQIIDNNVLVEDKNCL